MDEMHIGEFDNNPFSISGTKFITNRTAVMGMSGSGKSYLIGVLCEELCKSDLPFIIIDPEGEYKSLKQKFELVWACNEPGADVHLNIQICQKLAQTVVSKKMKLIFDTSESSNEVELVSEFLKHFYEYENKVRTPMLVIVEEADRFAPQSKGDQIRELFEISRRGRKRGIGLIIATQRPAMVDKNILSQCGNQFIGRLRTENDLNAISLFFRSKSTLNTIPDLEDGHFYAMGDMVPSVHKVKIRERETEHGGMTPATKMSLAGIEELDIFKKPAVAESAEQAVPEESSKSEALPVSGKAAEAPVRENDRPIESQRQEPQAEGTVGIDETGDKMSKRDSIQVDHFVWYPIHGKGYQDKPVAISGDFNPGLFTNVFKQEFAPLIMSYSQKDYRGFMLFNKPSMSQIIFSYIFHKVVDEYGRRGVIHHSAIVERKALANGEITLHDVEAAMNKFDDEYPSPKGDIPPLEVKTHETPTWGYQGMLYKYVSKSAVETLATRMMTSPNYRTAFRCVGADKDKRKNIAIYLAELLSFRCGIPVSFCTERPITTEYYEFFNLAVTERAIAPDANAEAWAVINWDMPDPGMRRLGGKDKVYKAIDEAFG